MSFVLMMMRRKMRRMNLNWSFLLSMSRPKNRSCFCRRKSRMIRCCLRSRMILSSCCRKSRMTRCCCAREQSTVQVMKLTLTVSCMQVCCFLTGQ